MVPARVVMDPICLSTELFQAAHETVKLQAWIVIFVYHYKDYNPAYKTITRNVIIFMDKQLHSIAEFAMFKQYKLQYNFFYSGIKHMTTSSIACNIDILALCWMPVALPSMPLLGMSTNWAEKVQKHPTRDIEPWLKHDLYSVTAGIQIWMKNIIPLWLQYTLVQLQWASLIKLIYIQNCCCVTCHCALLTS